MCCTKSRPQNAPGAHLDGPSPEPNPPPKPPSPQHPRGAPPRRALDGGSFSQNLKSLQNTGKKKQKKREKKRKSLSSSKERLPELQSWNFGGLRLEMPDVAPWEGPAATEHRKIPLFVSEKSTFLPYHRNNSPVLGGFCKSQGLAEILGGFNPDLGAHGCISSPGENPIFPQSCSHGVAPPSPL